MWRKTLNLLLLASLLFTLCPPTGAARGQEELPPLRPTEALMPALKEALARLEERKVEEALKLLDATLSKAKQLKDEVGEAEALWLRAKCLFILKRRDEAVKDWLAAAEMCVRVGDGICNVGSLTRAAVTLRAARPREADALMSRALRANWGKLNVFRKAG